ncbi:MAG: DUF1573 domain-containing protein [Spirochaetes bacterium]|nr:DUF1573 domain-containing protein [Spirochaetota bacterium]
MPAGGSGEIEITLKTGNHSGKLTKSVMVYTNDPEQNTIKLMLTAEVK